MPAPGNVLEYSQTEVSFLKAALLSSIRPDGRSSLQSRPVHVRFDQDGELGWAEVVVGEHGETRVVVATHAALVAPRADRPYEGFVEVRAEVQPIAGWQFERGRSNEEEVMFERGLDRILRRNDVVDREALCVVAGHRVWCITLNVHLLSAGGAALDASVLACISALRHFRRPDTSIVSATSSSNTLATKGASSKNAHVIVHDVSERIPIALSLHHHPLNVSFAIFDPAHMAQSYVSGIGGSGGAATAASTADAEDGHESDVIILIDPIPLEAALCTSKVLVVANVQGEICVLEKAGGRSLSEGVINRVIGLALVRVKQLNEIMETALRKDAQERIIGVN